ncbi:hypothetical protein NL676_034971 [Syzygium grande]|nr:hypothetical protein NL676_034971 [Syzygium grande]
MRGMIWERRRRADRGEVKNFVRSDATSAAAAAADSPGTVPSARGGSRVPARAARGRNPAAARRRCLAARGAELLAPRTTPFPRLRSAFRIHINSLESPQSQEICAKRSDHLHSNCLDRFRSAYGVRSSSSPETSSTSKTEPVELDNGCRPTCPLCRGEVTGWGVIDEARVILNDKKRCCDEIRCLFSGTYSELQKHAQVEHPHARPSKIDPARQLDWENFQQSSEIIDVLSTIHSEVPRGVVLGDYVIDYGDNDTGDEFEDFPVQGVPQGLALGIAAPGGGVLAFMITSSWGLRVVDVEVQTNADDKIVGVSK